MGIRKYKPTTPGRRGSSVADFVEVTRSTPEKSLVRPLTKSGGRNSNGRINTRHIGGGHKRAYRVIDFRRHDKDGVPAKVAHIEYDPNRTARIALLHYADGEKRYILAPVAWSRAPTSRTALGRHQARQQPAAAQHPDRYGHPRRRAQARCGAKIARSAGVRVQLVAKDGPYAQLRMPSGEIRNVRPALPRHGRRGGQRRAVQHQLGQGRPHAVEGQAPTSVCRMNPVDHPHGGGEGKTSGGRHPVSPWGQAEAAPAAPASRATS
ncbi:large subunit ribosomal protein L2 [Pedococcus dokdonensis]|uniref:50S ribosomal protein L2 n=1 Tax=Pedococcus dokdonensis TaxID=443156 RepID=A0A1H0VA00_9MICO|nr:50S ribosomal protein L2 [Pedococcus dokdonensis]SDP75055.1 large subunit ribosomal protein L2 [Pedococcus dokdonensis]